MPKVPIYMWPRMATIMISAMIACHHCDNCISSSGVSAAGSSVPKTVLNTPKVHSNIEISKGTITIQGMSLDNELVALFLTGLEDSSYFKNVELLKTEAKESHGFRLNAFEVSALLTSPNSERRELEQAAAASAGNGAAGVQRLTGKKL